jgi:propionyl-CoA synthetase
MCNSARFGPVFPTLPGSAGRLVPGYDVRVVDNQVNELGPNALGNIVIKQPLPPSFMQTLWRNDSGFIEKYLSDFPGFYNTSDTGFKDDRGYLHIMTRSDDVIKPAGHRISTGSLEEAINEVAGVVESATVGCIDDIRGEIPLAFVVLKD